MNLRRSAGRDDEPASKRGRVELGADQNKVGIKVAYISCPQHLHVRGARESCMKAVQNAIDVGPDVINISFTRGVDCNAVLPELKLIFDVEWVSSVGQPAYSHSEAGSVMTFFSARCGLLNEVVLDPEGGLPALSFTFSTPPGRLCIVVTSLPAVPKRTRVRLLDTYANAAADSEAEAVLIGGSFGDSSLFIENQVTTQTSNFQFFTNGDLCVLAKIPDTFSQMPLDLHGSYTMVAIWERAIEQPAQSTATETPENLLAVSLKPATPLYDNFLAALELGAEESLIDYIRKSCFFGKLKYVDQSGLQMPEAVPLSVKMEQLLRETKARREMFIAFLKQQQDPRGQEVNLDNLIFNNDDMKALFNHWRADVASYMQPATLEDYNWLKEHDRHQAAHLLTKQIFSAYRFQISGCKFLLHQLIRLPLTNSVGQPVQGTVLEKLLEEYEVHKQSSDYQKAVEAARKKIDEQRRLSYRLWWAHYNHTQGKNLSFRVRFKLVNYYSLSRAEQQMAEDYEQGRSGNALDALQAQRAPAYPGAGAFFS